MKNVQKYLAEPFLRSRGQRRTMGKKTGNCVLRTEVRGDFNTFSVITSCVNISCRALVFRPTKGTGGLQHYKFLIFDGKQHPEKIWFRGC